MFLWASRMATDGFWFGCPCHDPIIPINAESDEEGGLKKIVQELYQLIRSYDQLDLSPIEAYLN